MFLRIAVPETQDGVAHDLAAGTLAQLNHTARADLVGAGILEIGDSHLGEVALKLGFLGHQELLVLLGHLVSCILAQVALFACAGDGAGILRNLLGDDDIIFLAPAFVALPRHEQLLVLGLAVAGHQRLDGREGLDEAGEQRFFRQLLETLVEQEGVGEIARGLRVGGGEEVGDEIGVVAEDLGQRNAAGAGGLQRLVVDGEEDGAEQARRDEVVEELGKFLRLAVLDDPQQHRRAQVLLGLPALEHRREFLGVAAVDEEVDAFGGELALAGFEQRKGQILPFERMGILDQLEEMRLEMDGDLLGDVRQAAGVRHQFAEARTERGDIDAEGDGQFVAHGGTIEPLGRMELVAVLDGLGEGVEHGRQVGLGFLPGGGAEQLLGQQDASPRRAGVVEVIEDLVLDRDRLVAQHVAFGFLGRHGDARVLGDMLLGGGPPLFELLLADHLLERDLEVDGGRGLVGVGGQCLDDKLDGLLVDQLGDLLGFGLLAHQGMPGRQDVECADAKGRIHPVLLLALEIDDQLLVRLVVIPDLPESPAPVDAVSTGLHGLEFGFGRLERRIFSDERLNSFGIHNGGLACLKR